MRKVLLTILAAVLAVLFIPGSPANAVVSSGHYAGCYTIQKPGRYNDVKVGVTPKTSGSSVYVYAYISVTAACQKANSVPIHSITLRKVRLKDHRNGHIVRVTNGHSTSSKSIVSARTANKYMHCGHRYIASVEVSYSYTDGSHVRPFYVHGAQFTRC